MFFRGANSIEGGFFFKKIFVADSNEIAVSYSIGRFEFRHSKSSGHRPHLLAWEFFSKNFCRRFEQMRSYCIGD
jgi:hypothetical protein